MINEEEILYDVEIKGNYVLLAKYNKNWLKAQ